MLISKLVLLVYIVGLHVCFIIHMSVSCFFVFLNPALIHFDRIYLCFNCVSYMFMYAFTMFTVSVWKKTDHVVHDFTKYSAGWYGITCMWCAWVCLPQYNNKLLNMSCFKMNISMQLKNNDRFAFLFCSISFTQEQWVSWNHVLFGINYYIPRCLFLH